MVKVSIIVPVYNVERYLDRCMSSLLNQTLKDIEIIMVDDESPDNCPQMCDEYARKDERVKVIHKKNGGLGLARNSGLEIATGEYVAFVDSDDFVDINMYQELYSTADSYDSDIVYCGFYEYKNESNVKTRQEVRRSIVYKDSECHEVLHGMLSPCGAKGRITKYEMSVWHSIYRKNIFHQYAVLFSSERQFISEDIIFHIDYICHCKKIVFIPNSYYYYCLNDTSLSKKYRSDRLNKVDILCDEVFRRIKEKKYLFPLEDCMFFVLLSLRYPLTILKGYDMTNVEKYNHIREMCHSKIMHKWIGRIKWRKIPFRYIIFFLCIKYNMTKLLCKIIAK